MVDHEETEREILRLVEQAEGHDRAMLLIIYRMHQELISNTLATRQIAKSAEEHASILQEHARDEMALINQIRGGWRAATWSFAVITMLLGALQAMALRELNAARAELAGNTARIYALEAENGVQKDQLWSIRQHLRGLGNDKQ
ncbi:MAG: hypothetical protein IPH55_19790 [Betaproteobacteria bacterium]|nr:hypothetical protein [Betaproteobacteria bacterium]